MKKIVFAVAVMLLFFASCKYSGEYETVAVANKFSVDIPSWLKEDQTLKPGAEFQYANRFRNFYMIGESIGKADAARNISSALEGYVTHLCDTAIMKNALLTDSLTVIANGLNGARAEVFGKMDGETIYFSEVVLEGKKELYHLSIWTRSEERKLHFKGQIDSIIYSFREL
ncbi:MAG: hypothetical protein IPH78_01440 [Bacteroidetes bacterium]|nr:hypothetical protein [Bacteroidota bacterium]MBK8659464.1 hypothetical protein [Bacteroidota bacterium]